MLRTEEHRVRITTARDLAVDGVVQVRRVGVRRGAASFAFERREPVAVVVERDGRSERIPLRQRAAPEWLAWIAAPVIAGLVTRTFSAGRRKAG